MRMNMGQEAARGFSLTANGGTMTGALILAGNPAVPMEAATKFYVDSTFSALNANNILSGTIPVSSLPAFTGDASSSAGTNSLSLANIGVTPGSYAKVIVDAKGRVTGNDVLVDADIPNFDYSKITGKPTTLSGWGITDALSLSGGTVTGNLIVPSPTQASSIVTKQYVDNALNNNSIDVGDIVRKPYTSTPSGFLRCNGAELNKTTYAALYAVIGDNFNNNSIPGSGQPWRQQYQINNQQLSDITGWTSGTSLPSGIGNSSTIVTKNRIYHCGGFNGSSGSSSVYTAPINADGTIGTWTTGTSLPGVLYASQSLVTKNRAYLLGGSNGPIVNTVYYAPINEDGTLGSWITDTNVLPGPLAYSSAIITKNRAYLLGGANATVQTSVVYTAPVNSDGSLGTWVTYTSLPITVSHSQTIVTKNRVYLLGGFNGSTNISTVYTTTINSDGTLGTWITTNPLPVVLNYHQAFASKYRVYLFGGNNGSYTNAVYTAPINEDGTLGTWTTGTSINGVISHSSIAVTKNRVSLIGGWNGGIMSAVYTASLLGGVNDYSPYYSDISVNNLIAGSGRPWQHQYQINQTQATDISGWLTTTSLPVAISISQAIVTKNRVYILGGYQGGGYSSTVYTAPINGDGTLGTWTTGTALPVTMAYHQVIVTSNRVYILGGYQAGSFSANIYTAPINSDGTLGTWVGLGTLPGPLGQSQAIITKNRVYLMGGHNGSAFVSTVYTTTINSDGTLNNWTSATSLPSAFGNTQAIVTKNRVYLCSGYNGGWTNTVYTAAINADGTLGAWSSATSMPGTLAWSHSYTTKNRAYMFGGYNGSANTAVAYSADILQDGTLGAWTTNSSLVVNAGSGQLICTNNRLYLLGGENGASINTVQTAVIAEGMNDYSSYYAADTGTYTTAGSGKPWQQQYEINLTQSTDITGWTTGTALPGSLGWYQPIVTKNRVYLLGGKTGTGTEVATVYTAPINGDGTLGTWVAGTSLPEIISAGSAVVINNRIYMIGGSNATTRLNTVYSACINSDGTIGTWMLYNTLPGIMSLASAVVTKNRVYLIGGYNGSYVNSIYTAPINADGNLGSWTTDSNTLPMALGQASCIVTKNRVYLCGGNGAISNVYTAAINSDGTLGSWYAGTALPAATTAAPSFVTQNRAYLIGGYNGSVTATVYTAPINTDGTLGAWTTGTALPAADKYSAVPFAVNNYIYMCGGGNSNYVAGVYYASLTGGMNDYSAYYSGTITPNYMEVGSGKPWNQQYQINTTQTTDITGWTTGTALPSIFWGSSVVVTKNRVYLLGGNNGTTWVATVYTAPINTDGTLGTWTTGTNIPNNLYHAQAVVIKNYVYFIGGSNGSGPYSSVYRAPINSDGTIGTWVTDNALPSPAAQAQVLITKNRIYVMGGTNGASYTSAVFTAVINSNGTIGTWTTATSLPVAFAISNSIITKNRIYLISGYTAGYNVEVYTAPINSDGTLGTWVRTTDLPENMSYSSTFTTSSRVYLFGAWNGTGGLSKVYTAPINDDGTLGTWTLGTAIPGSLNDSSCIVTNNRIYLLGGHTGPAGTSVVYTASINGGMNDYSAYYYDANALLNYMTPGNGKPWQYQYQINNSQSADITGWSLGTALPGALTNSHVIVTKNRVYLCGGYLSGAGVATVYTCPINTDGTLGTWTTGTSLPVAMFNGHAIVTKNRVYLIAPSGANGAIYTAVINADGTLGTWYTDASLPSNISNTTVIVTRNRVYTLAGYNGSAYTNTVYTCPINSDGTLGTWTAGTSMPYSFGMGMAWVTNNRAYCCGGTLDGVNYGSALYSAPVNIDGTLGAWVQGTSLPGTMCMAEVFVTKKRVYILAGQNVNNTSSSIVYTAPLNDDGTVGTWSTGTALPTAMNSSKLIVTNNTVYLLGGFSSTGSTYLSSVYKATILEGMNDYSSYYNGTINPIDYPIVSSASVNTFMIPDIVSKEKSNVSYFIKY